MAIMMHPDLLYMCEAHNQDVQLSFNAADAANIRTRVLENKAALMVVTDALDNILLSIVGKTQWYSDAVKMTDHDIELTYRYDYGKDSEVDTDFRLLHETMPIRPRIPALTFTPAAQYSETIRNTGTAAKVFLIVDTLELYSATDVSAWPVSRWDGSVALNLAGLPASEPYLQLSVGDLASSASVRLTRLDLNTAEHTVQMADPIIYMYFTNVLRDWSTAKADLTALLTSIPEIGTDRADIEAKEIAAYGPIA